MIKNIFVFVLVLGVDTLYGQTLDGVASRWNDEFTEWDIYTLEGDQTVYEEDGEEYIELQPSGQLIMRWQMDLNWAEWDFTIDDIAGSIKQPGKMILLNGNCVSEMK